MFECTRRNIVQVKLELAIHLKLINDTKILSDEWYAVDSYRSVSDNYHLYLVSKYFHVLQRSKKGHQNGAAVRIFKGTVKNSGLVIEATAIHNM